MDDFKTRFRNTALLRLFTFLKIPLLGWISPSVLEINDERCVLKLPLGRRTKNHLGVMYFGALAMGAEAAIAAPAIRAIRKSGRKIDFIFKDFHADFLKRAEGDVHFVCEQGRAIRRLVEKSLTSRKRETETFESFAIVPSVNATEKVAVFKVSLSLKPRS